MKKIEILSELVTTQKESIEILKESVHSQKREVTRLEYRLRLLRTDNEKLQKQVTDLSPIVKT